MLEYVALNLALTAVHPFVALGVSFVVKEIFSSPVFEN